MFLIKYLNERSKNKKIMKRGNIVAQFAVLLVIAVIMIFIVTSFGAKLWSAFFPSGDKSALNSFETVNTMINAVMASPYHYESNIVGIYMAKNYEMVFYYSQALSCHDVRMIGYNDVRQVDASRTYYAPSECTSKDTGQFKQCICLYDDDPVYNNEKRKDRRVIRCKTFDKDLAINHRYFELNQGLCLKDSKDKYSSLIIAKNVTSDGKHELMILSDTDANRKLNEEWNVPMCADTGNIGGICMGVRDGTIINVDEKNFGLIYSYCSNLEGKAYKTTSVKCIYDKSQNNCKIDCSIGDISGKCGTTYTSCSDFNKDPGIVQHIDKYQNYGNYQACAEDSKYCGLGCGADYWEPYICLNTPSGEMDKTCELPQGCAYDTLMPTGMLRKFLKSYDESKPECKQFVEQKFLKTKGKILDCKAEKEFDCTIFAINKKTECDIKYLVDGSIYWITSYDVKCESEVLQLFDYAYFCNDIKSIQNSQQTP
jgi:hypothetical protein